MDAAQRGNGDQLFDWRRACLRRLQADLLSQSCKRHSASLIVNQVTDAFPNDEVKRIGKCRGFRSAVMRLESVDEFRKWFFIALRRATIVEVHQSLAARAPLLDLHWTKGDLK